MSTADNPLCLLTTETLRVRCTAKHPQGRNDESDMPTSTVWDPTDDRRTFGTDMAQNITQGAFGTPRVYGSVGSRGPHIQRSPACSRSHSCVAGTCYLISVLQCQAAMSTSESEPSTLHFPEDIIVACQPSAGVYICRFWHLGRWRLVLVDDYLPCRRSQGAGQLFCCDVGMPRRQPLLAYHREGTPVRCHTFCLTYHCAADTLESGVWQAAPRHE